MSVTVTIAGVAGNTTIETKEGMTVADVIEEAAGHLGIELDPTRLAAVVDGKDAGLDDAVAGADRVTAAPRVANG